MPKKDAAGRPVELELCRTCDADQPAAAALIRFLTDGANHSLRQCTENGQLMIAWMKEGMAAAHGWY
ncbi:DUF6300 family protein [Streptomyces sp. NPDC005141]